MRFVDSHAHLADPAFDQNRAEVVTRAREAGCRGVVCIGASIAQAEAARELAQAYPGFMSWTAGVHPHDAATYDDLRDGAAIRREVAAGAVAIGECGLDYHYDNAPRDVQRRVFDAHIELARELARPVIVHTRDAEADTIACIRSAESAGVRGVLHCFTGPPALAESALAAGWYVSFAGVVTFRKWDQDTLLRVVPDDRLLVESDAPYLAPVPLRGTRNEPALVAHVVRRVADARGVEPEVLGQLVTANAVRCFGLVLAPESP